MSDVEKERENTNERLYAPAFACRLRRRVPTALFVTVVPAVVVSIAVPQAANAVAVLALELVLLTLPGSCGGRRRVSKVKQTQGDKRRRRLLMQKVDEMQLSPSRHPGATFHVRLGAKTSTRTQRGDFSWHAGEHAQFHGSSGEHM